ncbi:MAG: hypothetical protein U1F87_08825 [Kiritimatiellia bacterium]
MREDNPYEVQPIAAMADLAAMHGRRVFAEELYNEALRIQPDDPDLRQSLAELQAEASPAFLLRTALTEGQQVDHDLRLSAPGVRAETSGHRRLEGVGSRLCEGSFHSTARREPGAPRRPPPCAPPSPAVGVARELAGRPGGRRVVGAGQGR